MLATEPLGHATAIRGLFRAAAVERLGHAILLRGARGVGKFRAASWLARGILCEDLPRAADDEHWSPCGVCGGCKKVLSGGPGGNHPDLLVLDPLEQGWNEIPVQAVAERDNSDGPCIGAFLRLASAEGRGRVVLVREAERLNAHAQNALLKTLEEPTPGTFLVLETSRPDALLSTISSRVLTLHLSRLEAGDVRTVLAAAAAEDERLAGRDLDQLALLADGAPGEALRLVGAGALETVSVFERWLQGGDALAAAAALWEVEGEHEGATASARDRARARLALELLRDLLGEAHRRTVAATTGERADVLGRAAASLTDRPGRALVEALERVLAGRSELDRNLDPGATLERVLVGVERCLAVSGNRQRTGAGA